MSNSLEVARQWYRDKEALDAAKAAESASRKETIAAFFGEELKIGTSKSELNKDMKLSLTVPKDAKIDKDKFKEHYAYLKGKGLIGDGKLFTMEPKFSATAYKYLDEDDKIRVDEIVTFKSGSPQLKVEVVKK